MAKIIFKVVKVIVKAIIAVIIILTAIGAGQITWTGIKNAWIGYVKDIAELYERRFV
jgi:hypothetical protein